MTKIKLLDVRLNEDRNATFGTCELCMSYGHFISQPTYIFEEVATGKVVEVEGYWWDWGDYDEVIINNVIDFADWISQQDFDDEIDDYSMYTYGWLTNIVWKYDEFQRAKVGKGGK